MESQEPYRLAIAALILLALYAFLVLPRILRNLSGLERRHPCLLVSARR